MSQNSQPIGIFDSGVGGLTVMAAVRKLLPHESIVYLGDTARVPYGTKSPDVVRRYSTTCAQFLASKNAKAIIVACNTATAFGLQAIEEELPIPVLGVIAPGADMAIQASRNGRIGVIGTEGTVNSGAYQQALAARAPHSVISTQACPLFVPLAEEGMADHPATEMIAREYLQPFLQANIDTLVLGCTHYPILQPLLQRVVGSEVTLVDSATAVAIAAQTLLQKHKLASTQRQNSDLFFATDVSARLQRVGSAFLGFPMPPVQWVDLIP